MNSCFRDIIRITSSISEISRKKTTSVLIALLYGSLLYGQGAFIHFGLEEGLSSLETYAVYQDTEGFIWVCSDLGINRYDGENIETFTTTDGLSANTVFNLIPTSRNKLWLNTINHRLGYYFKGRFYKFPMNDSLQKLTKRGVYTPGIINVKDSLILINHTDYQVLISTNRIVQVLPNKKRLNNWTITNKTLELFRCELEKQKKDKVNYSIWKLNENLEKESLLLDTLLSKDLTLEYSSRPVFKDSLFSFKNTLYKYSFASNRAEVLYTFQTYIHAIGIASDNSILVGTQAGLYKQNGTTWTHLLKDVHISGILTDKDNGLWLATHSNGVFYSPFQSLMTVPKRISSEAIALSGNEGYIIASYKDSSLMMVKKETMEVVVSQKLPTRITSIEENSYSKGFIFSSTTHYGSISAEKTIINSFEKSAASTAPKDITHYLGEPVLATGIGAFVWEEYPNPISSERILTAADSGYPWISTIFIDSEGLRWVGALDGIMIVNKENEYNVVSSDERWGLRATDITEVDERLICFATKGDGLLIWDKEEKELHSYKASDGLSSNSILDVASGDSCTLWVVTTMGIDLISFGPSRKFTLLGHWRKGGFGGSINQLYYKEGYLWLAGKGGVKRIEVKELLGSAKFPSSWGLKISVNGVEIDDISRLESLSHQENDIHFQFKYASFPELKDVIIYYRLNKTSEWKRVVDQQILLESLSSGTYSVEIKAKINGTQKEVDIAGIPVEIALPLWQRWWFIFTFFALSISIVGFGLTYRFRRKIKQKQEQALQEKKLNRLELRALKAQLNPHFIFNSMALIQYFVSKNKQEEAENYIRQFSSLIRLVLENSEKTTIPFVDEQKLAEKMVMLESYANPNKELNIEFNYKGIDPAEIFIPPALLQPYIENALWHGLKQKKNGGTISVEVEQIGEALTVSIKDNGIGRKAASKTESKVKSNRSFGMLIASRRIQALNHSQLKGKVEVIDLKSEQGSALGTKIMLQIPLETTN